MLKKIAVIGALSVVVLSGCSTLSGVKDAKGSGTNRLYNKPFENVWSETVGTVQSCGLSVVSTDKTKGEIMAENGMSAFSYGENVGVFVKPMGEAQTQVEVVSKRVLATNVMAKDWEIEIFRNLDFRLR